jgi:hypothetical protein
VYRGEVVAGGPVSGDRIAAEADLATGGPARRTRKSIKSRAEEAAGAGAKPRLIEAGGGKRLVESTEPKEGRKIIEAGGGRRPTAAEAKIEYETARDDIDTTDSAAKTSAETETETEVAASSAGAASPDGDVAEAKASASGEAEMDKENEVAETTGDPSDEASSAKAEDVTETDVSESVAEGKSEEE